MSNQQAKNNGNTTNGETTRDYSYKSLIEGCTSTAVSLNQTGVVYLETTTQIADKLADIIENTFGISEIDRVFIDLDVDSKTQQVLGANVLLCFDPYNGRDIVKYGGRNGRGKTRTFVDRIPYAASNGTYELSSNFKKFIGSLLPCTAFDEDEFPVFEHPENSRVACVEVDIDAVMALILSIEPSSPYACNLMFASPTDVRDGLQEYAVIFSKFIDISNRKRKSKRNNNINYTSIGKSFANKGNGHNNHNNGRGRR